MILKKFKTTFSLILVLLIISTTYGRTKAKITPSKNIVKQHQISSPKKLNTSLLIALHRLLVHPVTQRWFLKRRAQERMHEVIKNALKKNVSG